MTAPPLSHDALPTSEKEVECPKQEATTKQPPPRSPSPFIILFEWLMTPPPTPGKGSGDGSQELEKITQEAATNPVFQQEIEQAFLKTAGSQDNLHENVDQFTANIPKINTAFDDIRAKLYAVDGRGLKDCKGEIWKGESRWIDLRNTWRSLLKDSQDTARGSVTRCDEFLSFCEGILGITNVDDQLYKDTITELENFTKTPDPAGRNYNPEDVAKQATTHSQAFWDLKDKLTNFKSDFDDFARYQSIQTDPIIKDLNEKIQIIEGKIAFGVRMVMLLGDVLGALLQSTSTFVESLIAEVRRLNIWGAIKLLFKALLAIGQGVFAYLTKDCCKKEGQPDKLQGGLTDIEPLKEALEAVRSTLEDPNDGMDFILSQIDLLKNV